jgi:hypothetical protein
MRDTTFDELPRDVRRAVEECAGEVEGFIPAPSGNHAALAGVLRVEGGGRAFVKGARLHPDQPGGGAEAWSLGNEAAVNAHVQPHAPALLWQVRAEGWLLLGFEYIDGRHADFAPGSPDLELLAGVVGALGALPCPDAVTLRVEHRYTALDEKAAVLAGPALLHCDVNPANVLITAGGAVRVVDWAFCSRGAGWLECGFLVPWLVQAGHTPRQAEAWLSRFEVWRAADAADVDLFVGLLARAWARRDVPGAEAWISSYAASARMWHAHRTIAEMAARTHAQLAVEFEAD